MRQGCSLSPILFNLYINDFITTIKALDNGVIIGREEKVSILLYADDAILLAENEKDLQLMLDTLNRWRINNQMNINAKKSQSVHFRTRSVSRSTFSFKCGAQAFDTVDKYLYIGLTINEFLDFKVTAKIVSQLALDRLIVKFKALGGMPCDVFTKLNDSLGWPVIAYSAAI